MNALELLDIISAGETSRAQFKQANSSKDALAAEIVAMSNSLGGDILLGVRDKTGEITGLTYNELQEAGNLVSDIATNNVVPIVYIHTEVVPVEQESEKKNILVIHVKEGANKPYKDRNSVVWIKQGSDKRRVTDNNELLRLFQSGGNLTADEMDVPGASMEDIALDKVKEYAIKTLGKKAEDIDLDIEQTARNIGIIKNNRISLGGLLFFGKQPQRLKPVFCIKAVSFYGNQIEGSEYRDSRDLHGTIPELFEKGMDFFVNNLKLLQKGQSFNSLGILEISRIALEEVLQNALIHRDYFKNASVRLMIFDNRVELISPGVLPNSLTIENIKAGNAAVRNNLLASYCVNAMPYRGFGSGIRRALKEQADIELINDTEGQQFIVIIPRPESKLASHP